MFQLLQQISFLRAPLVEATAAEFAFLVPDKAQLIELRDHFPPVNVRQLETRTFDLVLDVTPDEGLHAFQFRGEESELELAVEVFGDDLRIFAHLEHYALAVFDDRHTIVALFSQFPNQRTVTVGDVGGFEPDSGEFQDAALDDAERTPRKLNQFNHVKSISRNGNGRNVGRHFGADKWKCWNRET